MQLRIQSQNSTWKLTWDPIDDLTPLQSKRSYEIMQIIKEKLQIDYVFKPYIQANRQEIEQKGGYTDAFEIYSCLKKYETSNFETRNPKVKSFILFNIITLSSNTCKVEEPGLNLLQTAENHFSNLKPELTKTCLQIITGWTAEPYFCPLVWEDWKLSAIKRS